MTENRGVGRQMPFGMHYQHVWLERARDPRLPGWIRVSCVAYGCHLGNGHAPLGRGELARLLGRLDLETGEIVSCQNVNRSIKTAIEYGWLANGSGQRCLRIPSNAIGGGLGGRRSMYVKCATCAHRLGRV